MSQQSMPQEVKDAFGKVRTRIRAERDEAKARQDKSAAEIKALKDQLAANPNPNPQDWAAAIEELGRIEVNVQQIVSDNPFPDEDMDGLPDHTRPPGAARRG